MVRDNHQRERLITSLPPIRLKVNYKRFLDNDPNKRKEPLTLWSCARCSG